jgi:hypothetical protein
MTMRSWLAPMAWSWLIALGPSATCAETPIATAGAPAGSAPALYLQYAARQEKLERSAFDRPLDLESSETADELQGDVHAVLPYPFAQVKEALEGGRRWCDILLLHLNVKGCEVSRDGGSLGVYIGKKFDEPLRSAHRIAFVYRFRSPATDYFQASLTAATGPFGTRDYRIVVEAVPLARGRTFVHLAYAYGYGVSAKAAMEAYLRTAGSHKVGFSADAPVRDGRPALVGGLRGALERNVMRYYLAIDAYMAALSAPPSQRLEERLHDWFDATERYALQLHELDEGAYLEMKRRECAPQSAEQ